MRETTTRRAVLGTGAAGLVRLRSKITMVFETEDQLSERGHGTVETLRDLLSETRGTKTQDEILRAAFDSQIPDEIVHLAWDGMDDHKRPDEDED